MSIIYNKIEIKKLIEIKDKMKIKMKNLKIKLIIQLKKQIQRKILIILKQKKIILQIMLYLKLIKEEKNDRYKMNFLSTYK